MLQATDELSKITLPKWFILQPPPNIDLQVSEWCNMALERLTMLLDFQANRKEATREFKVKLRTEATWIDRQLLGSYLLRLAAASHDKVRGWLIETEGDLFEYCFRELASEKERENIIVRILSSERVLNYYELHKKFSELSETLEDYRRLIKPSRSGGRRKSENDILAVHFTKVPWMISQRKGLMLYRGWLITDVLSLTKSIKRLFEDEFKKEIINSKKLLGLNPIIDQSVRQIIKELETHAQIIEWEQETFHVTLEKNAYLDHESYPPCMKYLLERLMKTGRLPHTYRVQFGAFLKRMGMDLETQLDFWYNNAVDNVNISKEQFLKFAGYQIRHLYGLEGGRKDYEVPKCSTAIASYFCLFSSLRKELVEDFLIKAYPHMSERQRQVILKSISEDLPKKACALTFKFTHENVSPPKGIHHPLMWVRLHKQMTKESKKQNNSAQKQNQSHKPHDDE